MANGERVAGTHRVLLYDKGCKHAMVYQGHARKFTASATNKAGRWRCNRVSVSAESIITSEPGQTTVPTIEYRELPSGGYWSVATYLDASQDIDIDDYTSFVGDWDDIDDPDYPGKIIFQRDATVTGTTLPTNMIVSDFVLPSNPWIELCLWRGEPPKDVLRTSNPPFTRIGFGDNGDEFALVIPYGGEAPYLQCWDAYAATWRTMQAEDKGKLPAVDGITKGQRLWISIRVVLGKLLVAFGRDRTAENAVTYKLPTREYRFVGTSAYYPDGWTWVDKQPGIRCGPLCIEHRGGQVAFRWWPLWCPGGAQYLQYLGEVETTYTIWDPDAPGLAGGALPSECRLAAANCDIYHYPVWGYDTRSATSGWVPGWSTFSTTPAVTPINPKASEANAEANTTYTWYATMTPVQFALGDRTAGIQSSSYYPLANCGGVGTILHCQSPILRGLQIRAEPYVAQLASAWPDATDISGYVQSISVEYGEGDDVGLATLQLQENTADLNIYPNQMIEIELGYLWSDASDTKATVFVGYVATPGGTGNVGPDVRNQLVAYGPAIRLRGEKAEGHEPDFQTFSPKDGVEWMLKRAGFTADQMSLLGDTNPMYLGELGPDGTRTGGGLDADNDALMPAFGSEALASVKEFCRRDNESEWWVIPDATHHFKFFKRNGQLGASDGTLFVIKEDGARISDLSDPDYTILGDIHDDTAQMDEGEYADMVVVQGTDSAGQHFYQWAAENARWYDTADPAYSGGWRHMYCEARASMQEEGEATERADQILSKRSRLPVTVDLPTQLITALVKGDRFHITEAAGTGIAAKRGILSTTPVPKHFRVVGYSHHWDGTGTFPRTHLQGRSIWTT